MTLNFVCELNEAIDGYLQPFYRLSIGNAMLVDDFKGIGIHQIKCNMR